MEKIYRLTDKVTKHPKFNDIAGFISLMNPVAMVPGLLSVIKSESADGASAGMFIIFLMLQAVFMLVAAQTRNTKMFWAMVISEVISAIIIVMIFAKGGALI